MTDFSFDEFFAHPLERVLDCAFSSFLLQGGDIFFEHTAEGDAPSTYPPKRWALRGRWTYDCLSRWQLGARIDMHRGKASDDLMNADWAKHYDKLHTTTSLYPSILHSPQAISDNTKGNIMETLVGTAYAMATDRKHLIKPEDVTVTPPDWIWIFRAVWWRLQHDGFGPQVDIPESESANIGQYISMIGLPQMTTSPLLGGELWRPAKLDSGPV